MIAVIQAHREAPLSDREATLLERVRQLEEVLAPSGFVLPVEWRLTPTEDVIFRVLLARELATYRAIEAALYSDRPGDPPTAGNLKVLIFKLRRKLSGFGVIIKNHSGQGYLLSDRREWRAELSRGLSQEGRS